MTTPARLRRFFLTERIGPHRGPLLLLAFGTFFMIRSVTDPVGVADIARNAGLFWLIFSIVVGIHELSHLASARILGIDVEGFALGFGRELIAHKAFGIRWAIRALPLGGFVKLRGEEGADGPRSFAAATTRRKVIVLLAGPAANILFAVTLLTVSLLAAGVSLAHAPSTALLLLQTVVNQTIAAIGGFIPAATTTPMDMPMVGIPGMISGVGSMLAFGPIMVAVLAAVISLSMGIMNALPLPPLDGGQAAVIVLRHVLGARYPERAVARATRLSFGFLMAFMAIVNLLDAYRQVIGYVPIAH
jgi:regulator of sigma E protease